MEKKLIQMNYEGNVSNNWEKFKRSFDNSLIAFGEEDIKEKRKVALFLHGLGEKGMDIYETFELEDNDRTLENIKKKFDEYFKPKLNVTYERHVFFNRKQKENESYEEYITILKTLSSTCKFGTLKDELVKDIFVSGIKDAEARENLLKMSNLNIEKALELCRVRELASKQTKNMEREAKDIEIVRRNKCEKVGHFAKACKSNGMAESAVKAIKNMFKKCKDSNQDPYLALLNMRNTSRNKLNSPAQILLNRQLRSNVPTQIKFLEPKITLKQDIKNLEKHKQDYKKTYDKRTVKEENSYKNGQKVMFRRKMDDILVKGKIVNKTKEPRSYIIEDDNGNRYRRNMKHIFPRKNDNMIMNETDQEDVNNQKEENETIRYEQEGSERMNKLKEGDESEYRETENEPNSENERDVAINNSDKIKPKTSKIKEKNIIENFNNYTTRHGRKIVNKYKEN
ncbi:putative autophagy-related protein 11 [Onthophagus taurus]|uniref:putative autophagy-related protein 11 n=1 Tax=Onthophagus taurus TaxID=166361 RepID=UPI0039BE008E